MKCFDTTVNGTWACENDNALNDLLKHQMGFRGCKHWSFAFKFDLVLTTGFRLRIWLDVDIMSDWQATHSTISAARGLDVRLDSFMQTSLT